MKNTQYRQGDVLIERVSDKVNRGSHDERAPILAEGEVSGHFHKVFGTQVCMYVDEDIKTRNSVDGGLNPYSATLEIGPGGASLRHVTREHVDTGEHDPILDLPQGTYHVINQREYDPEAERRAQD